MVNTQTHRQAHAEKKLLTGYTASSASWA